ncbi:beta strand repeat-containing protein, partial [Tabrizicola sp.]|uniref:beta strand repeat-containing protein n=1 Tax=Tabrizicola sp. TaxID=2005166 RepID=UPI0035B3058B
VGAAPIDAVADSGTVANGLNGGTAVPNVLVNDTLNGAPATLANVTLTQVATTNPNVTLNPATGAVNVAPFTPAGTYTVTYQICEQLNPANCDTTTVTTTVGAAPIDAVDDAPPAVSGFAGATLATVLGNDTLNGAAATVGIGGNVTLTPGAAPTPASGSITMNPDGTITVAAGTTAGTYAYPYTICEILNPTNCDTATATVVVLAAPIDAVDDAPATVNGFVGGTTATVLGNDTLAAAPVDPAAVLLIPGVPPAPAAGSITMNPDGTITVAAGTTAGTYPYSYTICERLNPTNCDTATASVVVAPPVILAEDNDFSATPLNGFVGGVAGNVLTNDRLNGATVNPAQTTITVVDADGIAGLVISDSGVMTVPAGTPAGTYTVEYRLCEDLNPGNCDTALVTLLINPPVIDAVDDDFTATALNGFTGGSAGNVLTNDRLNGATVNPALTTITVTDPGGLTGVTIADGGTITVPAGTPAGTYTVTYRLCEDLNPANCDTATVRLRVTPPVINAVDNSFPSVSGLTGATTASVLGNDTLNGAPVVPAQITLTPGTAPTPASGSITMNPDGTITVAAGTTAGTYAYPYTICEVVNPTNCDTATATVVVGLPAIDARPEVSPTFSGIAPPGLVMNVLTSDRIGGLQATTSNVAISLVSILTAGGDPYPEVTLDTATGNVDMSVPGPGGIVLVTYRICDLANPTNCDTQVETLAVLPLVLEALPEAYDPVNGLVGGTLTVGGLPATIIDSDIVDSTDATLVSGSANSVVIPAPVASDYTNLATGLPVTFLSLDPATGIVTVAPNTPAGSYGIFYEICDPLDLTRCDGITETVVVTAAPIDAVADDLGPVNGFAGGTTGSVLVNDTLNGLPVDPAAVTLTPGAALNPLPAFGSITLNPDGTVTVAPGTSAGIYEYSYTICEILNPTNCDTTTITIRIAPPVIDAVADTLGPVNGFTGGTLPNVLGNDTLNGAAVDPADVLYLPGAPVGPTPAAGSITLNPDGTVTVAAGTTAGSYEYSYTICDRVNPLSCDTATVTVVVTAAPIDAVDDDYSATPLIGASGGALATVLTNDTLNGVAVDPADITLAPGAAPTPAAGSITMNPDGTISVAAGTTAGTYSYPYTICEILNPTNCDTATATVVVLPAPIDAVDDTGSVANGAAGGTAVPNVLVNDTLNTAPATLATVSLAQVSTTNPNVTLDPATGAVSVAPATPAGTYTVTYRICERLNPANCDTATATVTVGAAVIDAVADTGSVASGATGGTAVPNVLANDTLGGSPATLATVSLTQTATTSPNVTLDPATGAVSVAPATPAGTYTVTYQICERLNPTNCDTTTVSVTVGASVIDAVDDAPAAINGFAGGSTATVLGNDTLGGLPFAPAAVTLVPGAAPTPTAGSITMNPDGTITVAAGTTAGSYSYPYTICEVLNPTNCDTATATVIVAPPVIDALDDDFSATPLNGLTGGTAGNVLGNDTLNGDPVDPALITIAVTANGGLSGAFLTPTGDLVILPDTPAGTYSLTYEICEILNPTNCDIALITVVIDPAPIDAVDDAPATINGLTGGATGSVLANDTLNGVTVDPAAITLTPGPAPSPAAGSITMNPDGTITVAAGTTAGSYPFTYEICEVMNPTNCDTATATVIVGAAVIDAVDDAPASINGATGGATGTVLANDTLNGVTVDPAAITLTPGAAPTPAAGSITMNADGTITVAAGTTAGTYPYTYEICEILNPANCDTATATVVVGAAVIDAVDDAPATISGITGGSTGTVLANDTLNGVAVDPAAITLTPGAAPTPAAGSITMNADGTITVAAGTTAGTYPYTYEICEILNP